MPRIRPPATALACAALLILAAPACTRAGDAQTSVTTGAPAPDASAAAADAAGWLVDQLDPSGLLTTTYGDTTWPDPGLTADAVLALVAVDDPRATDVAARLAAPDNVTSYLGDGGTTLRAGATAKLAATLTAAGHDPRDVAGRDLLDELVAGQLPDGRLADRGEEDHSQTVTQAWGVLALTDPPATEARAAATRYLLQQQCDDGGFRVDPDVDGCASDVDATAFAVSALVAAGAHAQEVEDAVAWLRGARVTDAVGAHWRAGDPPAPSANATAVAAAALADAGADDPAARAWLLSVGSSTSPGVVELDGEPDARATAQSVPALAGTGPARLLR